MTSFSDSFTQGGQTQLHKLHMIKQVIVTTTLVSGSAGLLVWGSLVFWELSFNDLLMVVAYWWARMCVQYGVVNSLFKNVTFPFPNGSRSVTCLWVIHNKPITHFVLLTQGILLKHLLTALSIASLSFCSISFYWIYKGKERKQSKILEGQTIVKPEELKKLIAKSGKESNFSFAGVPLVDESELQHILAVGTTGSGKTNSIIELLNQIREQEQKVVLIDTTGNLVAKYFRPGIDVLLNPLDARSASWNIWADCHLPHEFDSFAECLIPQTGNDPFWSNAAKLVFSNAAQHLIKTPSTQELVDLTMRSPLSKLSFALRGTDAGSLVDPDSEKTALSIRSTLTTSLKAFSFLEDNDEQKVFSIRDWIQNDQKDSWLFLSCKPDQRASLVPLMTAWGNLAVTSLMSLKPDRDRRVWFVVDEMQTLKKMHELPNHLEELRKYGGCYVIGVQNLSKLDSIYGADLVRSIASLVGTKLIFRSSDPQVAKRLSSFMGEQYLLESGESISYGAHQMRDGVNLTEHKRHKPLVSANDIITLNDLEAYLQLPGNWPIAKIKFTYHALEDASEAFVAKQQNTHETNDTNDKEVSEEVDETDGDEEIAA